MRRRDVLASLGGLGAAGLAGCLAGGSGGSPPDGDDGTDTTTPGSGTDPTTDPGTDPTTDPGTGTPPDDGTHWGPSTDEPFETLTIGSRDGVAFPDNNRPHSVRVWNGADHPRSITLSIHGRGDVVLQRQYEFPADGWLLIDLRTPATYELAVAVAGERAGTVTVERARFDCNTSTTSVAVTGEGAVDATTESTLVACAGPTAGEPSFAQGDGGCGGDEAATVRFADEAVRVSGTVKTPTPCYDLTLAGARLVGAENDDGADDVLVVTVATDGSPDGPCTDCVGGVEYELSVPFEHAYPATVRVVHRTMGGERTVRETSR